MNYLSKLKIKPSGWNQLIKDCSPLRQSFHLINNYCCHCVANCNMIITLQYVHTIFIMYKLLCKKGCNYIKYAPKHPPMLGRDYYPGWWECDTAYSIYILRHMNNVSQSTGGKVDPQDFLGTFMWTDTACMDHVQYYIPILQHS